MPLFETISNLTAGAEPIRHRRFGLIEMADGGFVRIGFRPWPKVSTAPGVLLGQWLHTRLPGDRLWLYFNQPSRFSNFLVLRYVVSRQQTSMGTLTRALDVLDEIARLKRSDALLCDVSNWRISERLMTRFGWERHCPSRWHRHYIKRFYGEYPPRPRWLERMLDTSRQAASR